jgi:hypothetical protein
VLVLAAAIPLQDSSDAAAGDDAAGERGRRELAEAVKRALEGQEKPKKTGLEKEERVFGLEFVAVEESGTRVLATGAEEEARRVAECIGAARRLFVELTGSSATLPRGLKAYLLGTSEAKTAFLEKHPALTPETRAALAKLEGAGVPGTADWAWWEGDAEKRLDALVRLAFDWLCRDLGVTTERHPWLHEGLGFYLTHALVGSRLSWFVRPRAGDARNDADKVALESQMDDLGADWLGLARGLFGSGQKFDLEELLHLEAQELDPVDHLRAHALAAYLVEVHRPALGRVLARVGAGDDPRMALEEALGFPFADLRGRLHVWLDRREGLVARAEGRRSEAELQEMWRALGAPQRGAALAAFEKALAQLDTDQMRWLRAALRGAPSQIPKAGDLSFYDPKVHAPGLPIARKRLSASDARVKRLLKDVRKEHDPRALVLAYDYDWGGARVVRTGNPDDPETVFRNALRGVPPGADLARALVLKALDHASERKLQSAFSHAYTDRDGNVYPVTLFETWSTGETIEMPDVDALGIVHDVLDEWKRWVSPVDSREHGPLYELIGELYLDCKRSRELRSVLAELRLVPAPTVFPGYEKHVFNLQALWSSEDSDPARLGRSLPDGKGWERFLTDLVARCQRDYRFFAQGRRRAAQLRLDAQELQKTLGLALEEGARFVPSTEPAGGR